MLGNPIKKNDRQRQQQRMKTVNKAETGAVEIKKKIEQGDSIYQTQIQTNIAIVKTFVT